MSVGVPGFIENVVEDAVRNVMEVVAAAGTLFAGHHPASPSHTDPAVGPSASAPSAPPAGSGGLTDGAGAAGETYQGSVATAAGTDDKLAAQLKQIFAASQAARDKVSAILAEISAKQRELGSGSADPAALTAFQRFVDQKMTEIQQVLSDAQVDASTQAQVLRDLADDYRGGDPGGSGTPGPAPDGSSSGTGEPADPGGGADAGSSTSSPPPVSDPLAGLGPLGSPMGMDPLGALAGLGGLGSALGGIGAGPLGGLGSALGSLGQLGGLTSGDAGDRTAPRDSPTDTFHDGPPTHPADSAPAAEPVSRGAEPSAPPASPDTQAPVAAAPVSAPATGGDSSRSVALPDGTTVEAPDAQAAQVMRAVLSGTSVADAYHGAGVELPPPGSPVLHPVDPSQLQPGDVAQFVSRPPVMVMGSGKIWMDGQLQPIGALGASNDFLGWSKPAASTPTPATPAPAFPAGAPPKE